MNKNIYYWSFSKQINQYLTFYKKELFIYTDAEIEAFRRSDGYLEIHVNQYKTIFIKSSDVVFEKLFSDNDNDNTRLLYSLFKIDVINLFQYMINDDDSLQTETVSISSP